MPEPNEHYNIALDRFNLAQKIFDDDHLTASHLYINSAIKFNDFLCEKYLHETYNRKHHSDILFISKLQNHLGKDYSTFKETYKFLMDKKNQTDYGTGLSETIARQIQRKATQIKEIAERQYS